MNVGPDGRPLLFWVHYDYGAERTVLQPLRMPTGMRGVYTASSRHPSIVNVLLADGSVRQIGNSIDVATWWGLGTRANNEVLGEF